MVYKNKEGVSARQQQRLEDVVDLVYHQVLWLEPNLRYSEEALWYKKDNMMRGHWHFRRGNPTESLGWKHKSVKYELLKELGY